MHSPCFAVFEEPEDPATKSYFSEIIASVSDVEFTRDGRYIVSRDYLTVKVRGKKKRRVNFSSLANITTTAHVGCYAMVCDT